MTKIKLFFILLMLSLTLFPPIQLYAQDIEKHQEKKVDFILRFGQGGFRDSRSPEGGLGGGQFALDIKPRALPFALSVSSEYYTNSPDPTHSYEIEDLFSVNLLHISPLFDFENADFFWGGGIGRLKVRNNEESHDTRVKSILYSLEAGIHVRAFRWIGFYSAAKYLNAKKKEGNVKVIDFNEGIILIGITLYFSL